MRGKKKSMFVSLTPHYGSLGTVTKRRRRGLEHGLRRWGAVRTTAGILACAVLAVGAYMAVTRYIIPSSKQIVPQATALPSTEESGIAEGSAVSEAEEPTVKYDTKTGLPIYEDQEILFRVNARNPLPESYAPELVEAEGITVDKKIAEALRAMKIQAGEDGVDLQLQSGFVSAKEQETLFEQMVDTLIKKEKYTKIMARAKAEKYVPKPGTADTQTGLCITVKGERETFAQSATYTWLNKFAVDFGFVFRYPEGKENETGLNADTRVLRYVGSEHATKMRQLSLCLEEYVDYLKP